MKIKLINLLNKIANGEEVPKIIKYKDKIYKRQWGDYMGDEPIDEYYANDDGESWFDDLDLTLDTELEIIEENKKIEKIEMVGCNVRVPILKNELVETDTPLSLETIIVKVNELIDKVNKFEEVIK